VTDRDLVSGIREGRVDALAKLIEDYHRPILRYLWQAGGSREDAEDLAAQALIRVRAEIAGFRGDGPLRAWIYRVAYRELLRHRRRQVLARLAPGKMRSHLPQASADDAVVLAEALGRIPTDQRDAFLLTEAEGLTTEEASRVLGIPPGTVKSRSHHARLRLRQLLMTTYGEPHAEPAVD
jgi:RNA polymerase sigma-70 factor (ECF subfamily)